MNQKPNPHPTTGGASSHGDGAGLADVFKQVLLQVRATPEPSIADDVEVQAALKKIQALEAGLTGGAGLEFLTKR